MWYAGRIEKVMENELQFRVKGNRISEILKILILLADVIVKYFELFYVIFARDERKMR